MKGVVFRSFLEFVESQYGLTFVDHMIEETKPTSEGAYTSIGTYDHVEMLAYVNYIAKTSDLEVVTLVRLFGTFLFGRLAAKHRDLVDCYEDSFNCLEHLDETIHRNVRKIHPQAKTPKMNVSVSKDGQRLDLEYRSTRPFFELSYGLLQGCIQYYADRITIETDKISDFEGSFVLKKHE